MLKPRAGYVETLKNLNQTLGSVKLIGNISEKLDRIVSRKLLDDHQIVSELRAFLILAFSDKLLKITSPFPIKFGFELKLKSS